MKMYRISITVPQAKVGTLTSLLLPEGTDFNLVEVQQGESKGKEPTGITRTTKSILNGKNRLNVTKDYFHSRGKVKVTGDEVATELKKHGFSKNSASGACSELIVQKFLKRIGINKFALA